MLLVTQRTCVIGRQESHRSEAVIHLSEIGCAGQYVVARVKRIETEPITNTEFHPGARHDLHQSHCTPRRRRMLVASALDLNNSTNPMCRNDERSDASVMNPANRPAGSRFDTFCAYAPASKIRKHAIS